MPPIKISLKSARVNAGLTQEEASRLIGIDVTTLIRWEKNPSMVQVKYLDKISKAYKFPSDYISFVDE